MKKNFTTRLLGVRIDLLTQEQLTQEITQHIAARQARTASFLVAKPYVEFLDRARRDPSVRKLLNGMDRTVADGVALQWAASYLDGPTSLWRLIRTLVYDLQRMSWRTKIIPERGAGVDATARLLQVAAQYGWRVGILGGPPDTQATLRAVSERFSLLQLINVYDGYFTEEEADKLTEAIRGDKLDVLFVALGFPRQEEFMQRHRNDQLAAVMIGEGGTFDYDQMGGPRKRAPRWMRRIGLEWLWRLLVEPHRIVRQLAVPRFIWAIYREGRKKKP